jgi:hypothetical protein
VAGVLMRPAFRQLCVPQCCAAGCSHC